MIKKFTVNNNIYLLNTDNLDLLKITDEDSEYDFTPIDNNKKDGILGKLTFNMSNTCNLKCKYCYADHGNYGREDSLLTKEKIDEILEELYMNKYTNINRVIFFGGEPLINFENIRYIVRRIDEITVVNRYEIVTNGLLIDDDIAEFLKDSNFYVTISLDGPEPINDSLRGDGVYRKVMESIELLKEKGLLDNIDLSCTYTQKHINNNITIDFLKDFFKDIGVRYSIVNVFTEDKNLKLKNLIDESSAIKQVDESIEYILKNRNEGNISPVVYDILLALIYKVKSNGFCDELDKNISIAYDVDGTSNECFRFWGKNISNVQGYNNKDNYIMCKSCWARNMCTECLANIIDGYVHDEFGIKNDNYCMKKNLYDYSFKKIINIIEDSSKAPLLVNNFVNFIMYR